MFEVHLQSPTLMYSKWCVRCYPNKREGAEFTYHGNSLCEECFKWMMENNNRPDGWSNDGKGRLIMSNAASMQKEIKELKTRAANQERRIKQYERMYDKQINPPVSIIHVDYKQKYEDVIAELELFKPLPLSGRRLFRKCKK